MQRTQAGTRGPGKHKMLNPKSGPQKKKKKSGKQPKLLKQGTDRNLKVLGHQNSETKQLHLMHGLLTAKPLFCFVLFSFHPLHF